MFAKKSDIFISAFQNVKCIRYFQYIYNIKSINEEHYLL